MKKEMEELSRREFARAAALTTAAMLVPVELMAQEQKPAPEATKAESPETPKLSASSQAEADLAYEALMRKYGSRFSEEQKKDIKRLIALQQSSLDKLRAVKLENGDQPAAVFQIYRGEVK